jgi:NADPH:quinone reductase
MKAVVFDAGELRDVILPDPVATGRDLLVRVHAVSVNPVDVKVTERLTAKDPAKTLGYDAAGTVEAIGPECSLFKPGDAVFYAGSIVRPGTNSELHLVDERIVGPKPETLSFTEAAAIPLTAITAWEMLFDRLQLPRDGGAGDNLLIIGGAGGVGSMAIQLARRLTAVRVIATASRPDTQDWCRTLGAADVIDHGGDMLEQLKAIGAARARWIFSTTHSDEHWPVITATVAPQGRVGLIDDPGPIDVRMLKARSASLHWEAMFARSMFGTPDMQAQHSLLTEVSAHIDSGVLKHTMTQAFGTINAATLREAHALVKSGKSRGKTVLEGYAAA